MAYDPFEYKTVIKQSSNFIQKEVIILMCGKIFLELIQTFKKHV